jgi:hypothetical protein
MTKIEVELLSNDTNAPVICLPGRRFPGVVLQGDSLKILLGEAQEAARLSRGAGVPELVDSTQYLTELLEGYIQVYEDTMKIHNRPLPY